jgi:hypothetical protein
MRKQASAAAVSPFQQTLYRYRALERANVAVGAFAGLASTEQLDRDPIQPSWPSVRASRIPHSICDAVTVGSVFDHSNGFAQSELVSC